MEQQIAIKELVPIVIACAVWGGQWRNKLVLARSDNMAVVQVITSLSSKEPTIMHLLRALFFYMALFKFRSGPSIYRGYRTLWLTVFPVIKCRFSEERLPMQTVCQCQSHRHSTLSSRWTTMPGYCPPSATV